MRLVDRRLLANLAVVASLVAACGAPVAATPTPASRRIADLSPLANLATATPIPASVSTPSTPAPAPKPKAPGLFGFGQTPTEAEISRVNIDVLPDGTGLPAGSGTPQRGKVVYTQMCASCHSSSGQFDYIAPALVSATPGPYKIGDEATVGNYWPYATTLFDYVRRAMPQNAPGTLSNDDAYAVVAFLLSANQLIGPNDSMNAQTLPRVQMPNQRNFVPCWPNHCTPDVK